VYSRCLWNICCCTIIRHFQQFPFKLICLDWPTFTCGCQNPNLIPLAWMQTCCKQKIRALSYTHTYIHECYVYFLRDNLRIKKESLQLQWQSVSADGTQLLQPKDSEHWAGAVASTLHTAAYGQWTVTFFNWWFVIWVFTHHVVCCVSLICRRNVLPPCAGWLNWSTWMVKRSRMLVT